MEFLQQPGSSFFELLGKLEGQGGLRVPSGDYRGRGEREHGNCSHCCLPNMLR